MYGLNFKSKESKERNEIESHGSDCSQKLVPVLGRLRFVYEAKARF